MARWTEADYKNYLSRVGGQAAAAEASLAAPPKRKGRMSDAVFNQLLAEDPRQGRPIMYELEIRPLPKASVRVVRAPNGGIRRYMPTETRRYMNYCKEVGRLAMLQARQPPYRVTILANILFCFKGSDLEAPTVPQDGDLDNLEKAIYDSMKPHVHSDDRLVSGHQNYKICQSDADKIVVLLTPTPPSVLVTRAKAALVTAAEDAVHQYARFSGQPAGAVLKRLLLSAGR